MHYLAQFKANRLIKKLKAMQQSRIHNQPSDEALKKEIAYYHTLAGIYKSLNGKKEFPYARESALECYRAASTLDDMAAQYTLGKNLLEEAKFREKLQLEGLFANQSNEKRMRELYEEAHAYLFSAQTLRHIEAKRLYGLCYINGWGVPADQKKGFELIVDSIDQENSWDKVPQIFETLGLNKPEFFSELTKHRKNQTPS